MIYLRTGIGIEFIEDDLLLASLQSNFSGGVFTHFKRIADYRLRAHEDLRHEVTHFFRNNGLSKDSIVLGIARKDMVLRYLDLPSEVADNLKQVIHYQVQAFEPTEEDSFYYDYEILNEQPVQKRLFVLILMVRKSLLDEHLLLLRNLDICPTKVIGSSMGLANLYLQNQKDLQDKTFLLANMGKSGMEMLAIRHGKFAYSRETLKDASSNWQGLFLDEVNEAISKLRLDPEGSLENIVLAGGSSESALEEIKARIPDCELFKKSFQFSVPGENKVYLQEAACCIGLAYTGIARNPSIKANLLPPELKGRQALWAYITAAVLGVVILLLIIGLGIHQTVQNRLLLSQLEQQIKALSVPAQKARALLTKAETLEVRTKLIENILKNKDKNLEILKELTLILPDDTYLQSYNNRDGIIRLFGLSGSSSDLAIKLEKASLLKDVVQKDSISKDPLTGKDRFTFEAKLEK
jgi:general secretion pathway protein L